MQKAKENEGYIILIKNGIFFIGVGKDAIILNRLLKLKLICMKEKLCKVGFQTRSIEKYIRELQKLNNSFVIYDYNKDLKKEEEIVRFKGNFIFEDNNCLDCKNCKSRKETIQDVKKINV